ncbi:hypothetical protein GGF31_008439 [Allomyces arbusculus]|nr:hypothetical protein GGF31_008439 [Allomyces arbusculus]
MFNLYQPAPVVANDIWERWDNNDWWDEGPVEGEVSVEDEETAEDEESVEDEGPVESEEDDEYDENEDEDDDEGSIVIVGGGYYGEIYSEDECDDDDEEELEAERAPLPLESPMILFPLGIEPRPLARFRWRAKLRPVNMRLSEPMIILNPAAREFEYDGEERRWTVGERLD